MKKFLLLFAALFVCVVASYSQADKTNKDIKAEFEKQREFAIDVDLSKTLYDGMNYEEFAKYMQTYENVPPELLNVAMKRYKASFYTEAKDYKLCRDESGEMPYRMHIRVGSISSKAGIKAEAVITYKDEVEIGSINLSIKDGRWNTFPKLLEENAEEQLEELVKAMKYKDLQNYYLQGKAKFKYTMKW